MNDVPGVSMPVITAKSTTTSWGGGSQFPREYFQCNSKNEVLSNFSPGVHFMTYTQSTLDAYNKYLSLKEKQYVRWASKLKYVVALFSEVSEQGPVVGHMPVVVQHSEAEAEKLL